MFIALLLSVAVWLLLWLTCVRTNLYEDSVQTDNMAPAVAPVCVVSTDFPNVQVRVKLQVGAKFQVGRVLPISRGGGASRIGGAVPVVGVTPVAGVVGIDRII